MTWFDVRYRLPDPSHHMVLVVDAKTKPPLMALGHWTGDFWWIESQLSDVYERLKPTHWMSLPDPPEMPAPSKLDKHADALRRLKDS